MMMNDIAASLQGQKLACADLEIYAISFYFSLESQIFLSG